MHLQEVEKREKKLKTKNNIARKKRYRNDRDFAESVVAGENIGRYQQFGVGRDVVDDVIVQVPVT